MRKRWPIGILIILAGLLVLTWVFPTTFYVPLGFMKGEATFDGKPTNYWVHALNHEGLLGQQPPGDAGKTLREGGAAAVPVLCQIAQGSDDNLRSEALLALSLMGPEAKGAIPVLTDTLKTEKNSTRFLYASEALSNVDSRAAGEALGAVLREKDENIGRRSWAFTALLQLAPKGQEALPALNEILHDLKEDPVLRVQAIEVLWHMKQPAEPLVPALCEMIRADNSTAGVQALAVLGDMGPVAKPAVPTLLKLLDKPNLPLTGKRWGPPHRAAVIWTLGRIGPEACAAVPALIASLQSNDYFVRTEVALALGRMGPAAKEALMARDTVWGASITLLAARSPGHIAVPALVQVERTTWIPREGHSVKEIRLAVDEIDPGAAQRAGIPPGL